jgi:serine/threonine-protein kinase HipA
MNPHNLKCCPSTLAEGFDTYSPGCLRRLFGGKKVSHFLQYEQPGKNEDVAEKFFENRRRISISGVQEKLSMILDKNMLRLTNDGEQGTYILKPIPADLRKADQIPANEHLTMQIAEQVYGINTAGNAMIFFRDGTPAYITRRFDVREKGGKWGKEDFASLAGKTSANAGPDFKYDSSYEECGLIIQRYVPAWRVEIEKYFALVAFNFLFSNGDGHLKNFSLLESSSGDYLLSPAYDLMNTRLHTDDPDFALDNGLFADNFRSKRYRKYGHPSKADFAEFAKRIGVQESRIEKLLAPFLEDQKTVGILINRSFLSDASKRGYLLMYKTRRNLLTSD